MVISKENKILRNQRLIKLSNFYTETGYLNTKLIMNIIGTSQTSTARKYMNIIKDLNGGTLLVSDNRCRLLINYEKCNDLVYSLLVDFLGNKGISAEKYMSLAKNDRIRLNIIKNQYVTTSL